MFKLPNAIPSLRNDAQDWADYAEYLTLKKGNISLFSVLKNPALISDEINIDGIEDDSDSLINKIDEISAEIRTRSSRANTRYPFNITNNDYTIEYINSNTEFDLVYKFLLLSTRLKMNDEKTQAGLDGTHLFERLSAEVALNFFGVNSEVDIMGTSKTDVGGFRNKLLSITRRLGEGGSIHENQGYRPQDDNVDIIAWKRFSDKLPSQVIAFGQCKTGTSWKDKLSELNIEAFCNTWFTVQPVLTPIRMFFCAQYFPKDIWRPRANEAGLVFDRFRIMDYLPESLNKDLLVDIRAWFKEAEIKFLQ